MAYSALVLWPPGEVDRARRFADDMVARAVQRGHVATAIALIAGADIFATAAPTQQSGTADEAKAMLTKTVSALKRPKHST